MKHERPQDSGRMLAQGGEVGSPTESESHAVSRKTYVADSALPGLAPPALADVQIGAATGCEVTRALIAQNRVVTNPSHHHPGPMGRGVRAAIHPFAEDDLEPFYMAVPGELLFTTQDRSPVAPLTGHRNDNAR